MSFIFTVVIWTVFGILLPAFYLRYKIGRNITVEFDIPLGDYGAPRRNYQTPNELITTPHPNVTTLYELLQHTSKLFPANKKLFGSRQILRIVQEEKPVTKIVDGESVTNTKTWKYFELSPFSWMTYRDVVEATGQIGSGLRHLGFQPKDKFTLFASTKYIVNFLSLFLIFIVVNGC